MKSSKFNHLFYDNWSFDSALAVHENLVGGRSRRSIAICKAFKYFHKAGLVWYGCDGFELPF